MTSMVLAAGGGAVASKSPCFHGTDILVQERDSKCTLHVQYWVCIGQVDTGGCGSPRE